MAYKGYDYYCTGCGRELNQDTVLFNMEPILLGSTKVEDAFRVLQFRMTLGELTAFVQNGQIAELGFRRCTIRLHELMGYVANQNNLNNPAIAGLTMEDIVAYTKTNLFSDEDDSRQDDADKVELFGGLAFAPLPDEAAAEETPPAAPEEQKTESEAILALERKNIKNADQAFIKENLRRDLNLLKNIFSANDAYEFDIQLKTDNDNEGQPVVIGYQVQSGWPRHTTDVDARVCCYCARPVFEYAGTAPHQAIAFIGDQKAGKTSTILALAHYAEHGLLANLGNEIWADSATIDSVATIEVLSKSDRLVEDLKNYGDGIAPPKNDATKREDAYCATFRVRNKFQPKYYLLTLTDLPGELCNATHGTVDVNKVMDEFQVALSCHAYILCFDTLTAGNGEAQKMTQNVCKWADKFQSLRYAREEKIPGHTPGYAPVMILYTKCTELENPPVDTAATPPRAKTIDLVKQAHVFYTEDLYIDNNPIYAYAGSQLREYDTLRRCYQARLRTSPFGYPAQSKNDKNFDPSAIRKPMPKQIDRLMRWILEVSGCVPTEASYRPTLQTEQRVKPEQNFITRVQYVDQNPGAGGRDEQRFREALARCYLFENPGYFDDGYVRCYGRTVMTKKLVLEEKIGKNNSR